MPESSKRTDAELIARIRAGEEDAFRSLCDRYAPAMSDRVRRRLSPAVLRKISISDILQDARLAAFEGLGDFVPRGEGAIGAWLAAIAENKALEAVRRFMGTAKRAHRGEVSRGARADTGDFAGDGASPSQNAMDREMSLRVRDAMVELPPDYRRVIELRQQEHLPFAEVAERLNRTTAAAKMLYGRAIQRLASILGLREEG